MENKGDEADKSETIGTEEEMKQFINVVKLYITS